MTHCNQIVWKENHLFHEGQKGVSPSPYSSSLHHSPCTQSIHTPHSHHFPNISQPLSIISHFFPHFTKSLPNLLQSLSYFPFILPHISQLLSHFSPLLTLNTTNLPPTLPKQFFPFIYTTPFPSTHTQHINKQHTNNNNIHTHTHQTNGGNRRDYA